MSKKIVIKTIVSMGVALTLILPVSFAQGQYQETEAIRADSKQSMAEKDNLAAQGSDKVSDMTVKDLNKKLFLLNEAIRLNPKDDQAYLNRAELYKEIDKRAMGQDSYGRVNYKLKAIEDIEKAIALNPSEQNYSRGCDIYFLVRYSKNEKEFNQIQKKIINFIDRAIKRYPKIGNLYFARVALTFNEYDGSMLTDDDTVIYHNARLEDSIHFGKPLTLNQVQDYMKYLELNPPISFEKISITDIVLGDLIFSYRRGVKGIDLQKLSDIIDQLIKNNPDVSWLRLRRITVNNILNMPGKALNDYEKLVEIDPTHADAYFAKLGDIYYARNNYKKAIDCYDRSLRLAKYADVYNSRGNAFIKIYEYDRAIQDYQRALELEPYNEAVKKNMKDLMEKMKN